MKKKVLILTLILTTLMLVPVFATGHINGCTNTEFSTNCCTKTFSLIPKAGYKIVSLIVNGVSQPITEEQKNGMTYTFSEITEAQTLEVIAEPTIATITVTQATGGTITPVNNTIVNNKVTVECGQTQSFTITPDEGYKLSALIVDGKEIPACSKYTFGEIDSNHTISATFEGISYKKVTTLSAGYYIICNNTTAMSHSNTSLGSSEVTISNNAVINPDSSVVWYYNGTNFSYTYNSTTYYLNPSSSTWSVNTSSSYTATYDSSSRLRMNSYYLRYYSSSWRGTTSSSNASTIDLYKLEETTSTGNYKVTFNPNGGSGGMAEQYFTTSSQNLSANQFTRNNYKFVGWSTTPIGSVTYTDGQRVRITADTTLYAVWVENLTITYNANGGTGTMEPQEVSKGIAVTLSVNQFTHDTLSFAGWATSPNGDISYYNNSSYTPTRSVTLYAVWRLSHNVTFDANGGTGTMATQAFVSGVPQNLKANTFTYYGKTFTGWSTTRNGAVEYGNGVSFSTTQDITLYAQWTTTTYTLTYNARGGSGAPAQQTWLHGGSVTIASAQPTCNGCTFQGWYTGPGGTGNQVIPGTSYNWTSDTTIYAYWKCTGTYYSNCSEISTKTSDCYCFNGTCNLSNGHEEVISTGGACSSCGHKNLRVVVGTCSNTSCTFDYTLSECLTPGCSVYELNGKQVHTGICAYCKGERKIITGYYCNLHRIELTTKTEDHCLHGQTSSHNY